MSESEIKALQQELEDESEMCDTLKSIEELNARHRAGYQRELDALTKALSALKSDDEDFAPKSERLADITEVQQRLEREQRDVQSKLRQCEQQKRELQQRIDDMSAAP